MISKFSKIAGYIIKKINGNCNSKCQQQIVRRLSWLQIPFTTTSKITKLLGIILMKIVQALCTANFEKLLIGINEDMNNLNGVQSLLNGRSIIFRWATLPTLKHMQSYSMWTQVKSQHFQKFSMFCKSISTKCG